MGMFDYVQCKMALPSEDEPPKKERFQTKSFDDSYMDTYVIEADGALSMNGQPFEYNGIVNFYCYQRGDGREWWEYDAKFIDGKCVSIVASTGALMGRVQIPKGVYYSAEADNFYRNLGGGMGMAFWQKWRHVSQLFPKNESSTQEDLS